MEMILQNCGNKPSYLLQSYFLTVTSYRCAMLTISGVNTSIFQHFHAFLSIDSVVSWNFWFSYFFHLSPIVGYPVKLYFA